jgi:uncharacterized membrane protein
MKNPETHNPMNSLLSLENLAIASERFAVFIGYIGILVIFVGCVRGLWLFARKFVRQDVLLADIRLELGHYLALGLEFLVGKDIIESLVQPTWDNLGKLAAIIILRTSLTFFLSREVHEMRQEMKEERAIRRLEKEMLQRRGQSIAGRH